MLAFTVLFTVGCQPTPEELIVQNKADGELMNAVNAGNTEAPVENAVEGIPGDDASQNDIIEYKTIDRVSFELELSNGVKLNADADVTVPDSVTMPVLSYKRKAFSDEFVNVVFYALLGDKPFYEINNVRSKSQIEEQIIQINFDYDNLDSPMAIAKGITDLEKLHSLRDETLNQLYEELITAPDVVPYVEINRALSDEGYVLGETPYNSNLMMELKISNTEHGIAVEDNSCIGLSYTLILKDVYSVAQIVQYIFMGGDIQTESMAGLGRGPFVYPANTQPSTMTMTPEEAIKIAEEIFHVMGAGDDAKVSDIYYVEIPQDINFGTDSPIYCYGVVLKRYINGMPIEIESSSYKGMEKRADDTSDQFNAGVPVEEMRVFISDEGIIDLLWREPTEVVEIMNQNVELVSTSDIVEVFKQEFKNAYSYYEVSESENIPYSLYDIKLNYGLARIPNQNDLFMAIPLWEFFATISSAYYNQDGQLIERAFDIDLITINGIDKSRFSRQWGY